QELPFEKLVEELQPERNMSHNPLFQVMLTLQKEKHQQDSGTQQACDRVYVDNGISNFDLVLSNVETKYGLFGALEYQTALFDESTICRMAGHDQRLLEAIVADPEQRISTLALLSTAERHQL